jgi:hypothetical protein
MKSDAHKMYQRMARSRDELKDLKYKIIINAMEVSVRPLRLSLAHFFNRTESVGFRYDIRNVATAVVQEAMRR